MDKCKNLSRDFYVSYSLEQVSCTPPFGRFGIYAITGPLALGCVNPIPISTSWHNLYIYMCINYSHPTSLVGCLSPRFYLTLAGTGLALLRPNCWIL